jgi:hypothetical protein
MIYGSSVHSTLTLAATFVVLLVAVLAAIDHGGERRAFHVGFAFFGIAYLWAVCGSWQSPDGAMLLRDRLPTTAVLHWCHEKSPHTRSTTMMVSSPGGMSGPGMGMSGGSSSWGMPGGGMMPGAMPGMPTTMTVAAGPEWVDFATTGHALFALAFAMLGGILGRLSYQRAHAVRQPVNLQQTQSVGGASAPESTG